MALEARLIRSAAPLLDVRRTGVGRRRALASGRALAREGAIGMLVIAGFGGGLERGARAGEIVVADELRGPGGERLECSAASVLATGLQGAGIEPRRGVLVCSRRPVLGRARTRLHDRHGALAADMESIWLAREARAQQLAVVRVLADAPAAGVWRPWRGVEHALAARRALIVLARALGDWANARAQVGVGDALGLSASTRPSEGGGRVSSTN